MRARRVDDNLAAIVAAALSIGLKVYVRNDALADLDVQFGGMHEIWEVKDGRKAASRRKLTKRQIQTRAEGWYIRLVTCIDDVLAAQKTMLANLKAVNAARLKWAI